jgi:hypothetical protein
MSSSERAEVDGLIEKAKSEYVDLFTLHPDARSISDVIRTYQESPDYWANIVDDFGWRDNFTPGSDNEKFDIAPDTIIVAAFGTDVSGPFSGNRYYQDLKSCLEGELQHCVYEFACFRDDDEVITDAEVSKISKICTGIYALLLNTTSKNSTSGIVNDFDRLFAHFETRHYSLFTTIENYIRNDEHFGKKHCGEDCPQDNIEIPGSPYYSNEANFEDTFGCHLMFFDPNDKNQWEWALSKLESSAVGL